MKFSLFGALASLALSLPSLAQSPFQVGRRLPELRLPTVDGETALDLSGLRGKKHVLIEFASW